MVVARLLRLREPAELRKDDANEPSRIRRRALQGLSREVRLLALGRDARAGGLGREPVPRPVRARALDTAARGVVSQIEIDGAVCADEDEMAGHLRGRGDRRHEDEQNARDKGEGRAKASRPSLEEKHGGERRESEEQRGRARRAGRAEKDSGESRAAGRSPRRENEERRGQQEPDEALLPEADVHECDRTGKREQDSRCETCTPFKERSLPSVPPGRMSGSRALPARCAPRPSTRKP